MKLILLRHAETPFNKEGRSQGSTDTELTPEGIIQAKKLAQSLKKEGIHLVYTSPLKRAVQTASLVSDSCGTELRLEPALRELEQGELEGLTPEEMRERHPEILKQWAKEPAYCYLPGGECMADAQERAWTAIQIMAQEHSGMVIAAVSHNLTILGVICKVLDLDLNSFRRFRQDIAAKHIIEFGQRGPVLRVFNDTSHLRLPD